jgi:hypothetical protein
MRPEIFVWQHIIRSDANCASTAGSGALLIERRDFPGTARHHSSWTAQSWQRRKLVGERHGIGAVDCELALADHVDQLDAGKHIAGDAE